MPVRVVPVPVLSDNYAYLLVDEDTKTAAAVDPVEPEKVLNKAKEERVQICAILTTHSHWDHAGGNRKMLKQLGDKSSLPVVGGKNDGAEAVTREVADGDTINVGNTMVKVFYTPCHTPGHVLYLADGNLFTGDTLFISGCGNFNNGTPQQMNYALNEVIAKLPEETKIWCGHEYTLNNLKFAAMVEPENERVKEKLEWAKQCKAKDQPTIPSTVKDELAANPFMRVGEAAVQNYAEEHHDLVKVLAILRKKKSSIVMGGR